MKNDTNFSSNPLKVILPEVGELSKLRNHIEEFKNRLITIRAEKEQRISKEEDDDIFDAEEQMLIQVLQWLSAGDEN